jgi:hypothetical protein
MTAERKVLSHDESIVLELHIAEITGGTSLTFNGHNYSFHFLNAERVSYALADQLKEKYFLVRGWGFGGRGWGYTVIFNQDKKGIFNRYPHQL